MLAPFQRSLLELLRPGELVGREDEVQPLQGVDGFVTELLPLEQLHQSAVKLLQLRLLDLPGKHTYISLIFASAMSFRTTDECSGT